MKPLPSAARLGCHPRAKVGRRRCWPRFWASPSACYDATDVAEIRRLGQCEDSRGCVEVVLLEREHQVRTGLAGEHVLGCCESLRLGLSRLHVASMPHLAVWR